YHWTYEPLIIGSCMLRKRTCTCPQFVWPACLELLKLLSVPRVSFLKIPRGSLRSFSRRMEMLSFTTRVGMCRCVLGKRLSMTLTVLSFVDLTIGFGNWFSQFQSSAISTWLARSILSCQFVLTLEPVGHRASKL